MDFFKSIILDIKVLNPNIKRKFKIVILKLVDDACRKTSYYQSTSILNVYHASSENQHNTIQPSLSLYKRTSISPLHS